MASLDREAMQAVVERIQRLSDEHWSVLDPSCRLMENDAWVGPTGSRFGTEIHAAQRELRALLTSAVHSAQTKLASLPAASSGKQ
ncbi:hypothetical protein [Streptosporangium pseudovulgare]|uniref:WXG100 family type VII secretion target n=1 Tax=Streptosporangium pseudovulgare TaxID=35765 RepID=A0ABQ2QZ11_9ACTN|nr:hypothetical protein [Streptosporangium pseudovulgare]GGQ00654.1 hypothetical protein GCM10010140_33470 [Streptosporangium pseudovulgare]